MDIEEKVRKGVCGSEKCDSPLPVVSVDYLNNKK